MKINLHILISTILLLGIFGMGIFIKDNFNYGTYSSISFNGKDNVECHSVRIDHNNILRTYHFEEECHKVNQRSKE